MLQEWFQNVSGGELYDAAIEEEAVERQAKQAVKEDSGQLHPRPRRPGLATGINKLRAHSNRVPL